MSEKQTAVALRLNWNPVPASLPPQDPKKKGWFSPNVWLALSDGRVMPGCCLHRHPQATYDAPVHAWFIEEERGSCQLSDGIAVVAWMPFAVPDRPGYGIAKRIGRKLKAIAKATEGSAQ